jgi:predicted transcriptional regulator
MRYTRTKIEIVCDILLFIKNEENGAKSTHILYKANLSPDLLKKYLSMMKRDGLIRKIKKDNGIRYRITKKGLEFLKKLKAIDKMTHIIEVLPHNRVKLLTK